MTHKDCYAAVDLLLRDIMKGLAVDPMLEDVPFGGKVVVLAGDFRQTLPVVIRGTRAQTINASVKKASFWPSVNCYRLTLNMRVNLLLQEGLDPTDQAAFSSLLLSVGNGEVENPFYVPPRMLAPTSQVEDLLSFVFGDLSQLSPFMTQRAEFFIKRAILTPKNVNVNRLNQLALQQMEGVKRVYLSADTIPEGSQTLSPSEFLNSLDPPGMPEHVLTLQIGCPIMLLRNLNSMMGLANGTPLIVTNLNNYTIQVRNFE